MIKKEPKSEPKINEADITSVFNRFLDWGRKKEAIISGIAMTAEEIKPATIGESLYRLAEYALPVAAPNKTDIALKGNASVLGESKLNIANGEINTIKITKASPIPPPISESLKS